MFAELHIAAGQVFRSTELIQAKDAGVLTGRYLAAEGSATRKGSGFEARQTAQFTIRAADGGDVALELRADPKYLDQGRSALLAGRKPRPVILFDGNGIAGFVEGLCARTGK